MQTKIAEYTNRAQKTKGKESLKDTRIDISPAEWKVVGFDKCISKKRFKVGKVKKQEYKHTGKYPIIDQSQDFVAGYTNDEQRLYNGNLPVVIFGDHTRVFKYVNFPFILGADGSKVLVPNENLFNPEFFYYALLNLDILSLGYSRHFKLLKEKIIQLPPLSEQRKIAKVLSTIQRANEQQDKVIEVTKNLKKSMMSKLFTEGFGHTEFKETEFGQIPASWETKKLGEAAEVKTSTSSIRSLKKHVTSESSDDTIKILYLKVSDLNLPLNTRYIVRSKEALIIRKEVIDRVSVVPPFSTVFPKRGGAIGTNKKRITKFFSLLDPNLIAVIPSQKIDAMFLYHWFQTFDLLTIADKTPIPQLNKKDVEPIQIPLPPLHEQEEIAHILSAVDNKIEVEERRKVALNELFKTMLHELMAGEIRLHDVEVGA